MGIVIRQSIKATIVNYVGAFIGFLTTMFILTKYVQPDVIGLTKVLYEAAAFVANIAAMGITSSTMRFFPYFRNKVNKDNGFFFYLLLVPTIGIFLCVPFFFLLKIPLSDFFSKNSALFLEYYYWIIPLVIFIVYWLALETYSTQKMHIVIPKFIWGIVIRLLLMVAYLLYAFNFLDLDELVILYVATYGIALMGLFIYVYRIGDVTFKHDFSFIDPSLRSKIIRYTLFMILGTLGGGIIGQLDVFMVSSQMGLSFTGIYTIALYIAAVIEMPARSITSIASPIASSALKDGDFASVNQLYKKVALHQLISGSTIFLFIWINIDNIFLIIPNGNIYEEGKWVVFFIALSKLIIITLGFGSTLISFSRYYYWGLYFTFFLTILTVGSNYVFIPIWGMSGAAVATLLTCIISYSWQQWIVLKKIQARPYSKGILKQLLLILVLFGINCLLPVWENNPFLDGVYRSFIIGGLWIYLMYKFKISDEICLLIKKGLISLTNRF